MQDFTLHEFRFGQTFYLLLPKLNPMQVRGLSERLKKQGFDTSAGRVIAARRGRAVLRLDPSGLCWSNADPGDLIVPAIPGLLDVPKQEVPLEALQRLYVSLEMSGTTATARPRLRMEGGSLWRALRGTGQCGLAPDEFAVIQLLLEHTRGQVNLLTDFPTTSSRRRVIGGRQYFETGLNSSQAHSTLASISKHGARNSYIPQRGVLRLATFSPPSRREWVELSERLGEWCYFRVW